MSGCTKLIDRCKNEPHHKEIFKLLSGKMESMQYTADGVPTSPISHTTDEIATIQYELYGAVQDNYLRAYGTKYRTLDDINKEAQAYSDDALKKVIKDGFYNPLNGVNGVNDPSRATTATIPLLIGPSEVTALYANGGISQIIIDKKSKGVLLNGYRFKSSQFNEQELVDLQGHAEATGFSMALNDVFRDGNIYGGSALFPILFDDNPLTTAMTVKQLLQAGAAPR